MKSSVRGRLLAGVGGGVAIAFVIAGVLVFVLVRRALVAQFDDGLRTKAKALSILVERDAGEVEVEDISPDAPLGEGFEITFEGQVVLRSTAPPAGRVRSQRIEFVPRGEGDRDAAAARPMAAITYTRATAELDASIAQVRNILVGVGGGALVLLMIALYAITRRGLLPVEQLAADIAAVTPERLAPISDDRPRELVVIARRLNELLGRVDQALQRERVLTAEVAHELRTPLSGLRATIDVALDRERPPERYREALGRCLSITRQTERMVESMLSLAKLDAGLVEIEREPVELAALIREIVAAHARVRVGANEVAGERAADSAAGVELELEEVTVETDRAKVASILHNLVDNALTYGGRVRVELAPGRIRILNPTTLEDASHVFERFWRGDAARTAGAHAGLGLAICKRLVEVLGWRITAAIEAGQFVATISGL